MIKILQYGEGNFLRTFVDAYFDSLNKKRTGQVCGEHRQAHSVRNVGMF